jgi:hypothetical protein
MTDFVVKVITIAVAIIMILGLVLAFSGSL